MKGSIHSDQTCPVCGRGFQSLEPKGLFCPEHPDQSPSKFKVRFGKITRRFNSYRDAHVFLTGLRFQASNDSFDARDFMVKDKPLGFSNLADEWLEIKRRQVKPASFRSLKSSMTYAIKAWSRSNIKSIGYAEIEDFLLSLPLADKTKANTLAALKQFWDWARKRHGVPLLDDWPSQSYEMEYRTTISLETQQAVLDEVYKLTEGRAIRIWIGIKWLTTYIDVRPGEMLNLLERNVDRDRGLLVFPHPKEKKPKVVFLLDEDIELIRDLPRGLPDMPFFRHDRRINPGCRVGQKHGNNLWYNYWRRACKNLGLEGVSLYPGTKHSTAQGLRKSLTFEQVRTLTGHATNAAFERYFRTEGEAKKTLYKTRSKLLSSDNETDNGLTTDSKGPKKPIPLKSQ